MNILGGMCDTSYSMYIFLIVKVILKITFIVVPVVIVIRSIVPFFRASIENISLKELLPPLLKSILAALVVYFIPGLVDLTFTKFVDADYGSITYCMNNSSIEKINELKEKEEEERKKLLEAERKEREKEYEEYAEAAKRKEAQKLKEKQEQQGQGSGGTTGRILKSSSNNIIIGDSRTVGMCGSVTGNYTGCSFSNGGPKYHGNDIFISQSAMGYSWFESTAIPTVNRIIAANPDVTYNIYSLMGANFLLADLNSYIVKYNELSTGAWSKHNIILVSVNPVNEEIEAQHGYKVKNVNIVSFNNQLRNGTSGRPNIMYCDTYNIIVGTMQTSDGLHYSAGTNIDIYNEMIKCSR